MIANSTHPDPVIRTLLDFIAIRESDGDYDAYFGRAHPPDGTITGLNIEQLYAFQHDMLDGGAVSTAVGRYQFIHRTLTSLVQRASLTMDHLFDPATQDMLAAMLLADRQLAAWQAGTIGDDQFAHNLSCEWASLPDPYNGGRSHYDGDGARNHAGQTLDAVFVVLAQVKATC